MPLILCKCSCEIKRKQVALERESLTLYTNDSNFSLIDMPMRQHIYFHYILVDAHIIDSY